MFRKILISLVFVALVFAPVFATETVDLTEGKTGGHALELIGGKILPGSDFDAENNSAESVINSFFQKTTTFLIGMTTAVAVIFLIIGGYQYLTSFGNEEQIKSAHKTITFSLAGVALALLAFAIVQIVINIDFEKPEDSSSPEQAVTE